MPLLVCTPTTLPRPVFLQAYRWHPWFGIGTVLSALAGSLATTGVFSAEKNVHYPPILDPTRTWC